MIYVAGYGRSGSTLLGRILATNGKVLDLGEVMTAPRFVNERKHRCTCGSLLIECPVWGEVLWDVLKEPSHNADRETHRQLLEAIAKGSDAEILIDSSKTAALNVRHLFYLKRNLSMELRVLQIVRDPRGIVWSIFRSRRKRGMPSPGVLGSAWLTLKVSASWMLANLATELFLMRHRGTGSRLLYDEFLQQGLPQRYKELVEAESLEGLTLDGTTNAGCGAASHAISGNPMRYKARLVIARDDEWRERLPKPLAALTVAVCLPLMVTYGLLGAGVHPATELRSRR